MMTKESLFYNNIQYLIYDNDPLICTINLGFSKKEKNNKHFLI